MKDKPFIMYESDKAASRQTVTGWVSSSGRFWGDDEHMARYDGSSHALCECGQVRSNSYTVCNTCREKGYLTAYLARPEKEWDRIVPVFSDKVYEYFFDIDEVREYADDHDTELASMRLIICVEEYARTIDGDDLYHDLLPDDLSLMDVAPELAKAFDSINELILKTKPVLSWKPGKFRTSIPSED